MRTANASAADLDRPVDPRADPSIDRRTALARCFAFAVSASLLGGPVAPPRGTIVVNGWVLLPDDLKGVPSHAP